MVLKYKSLRAKERKLRKKTQKLMAIVTKDILKLSDREVQTVANVQKVLQSTKVVADKSDEIFKSILNNGNY